MARTIHFLCALAVLSITATVARAQPARPPRRPPRPPVGRPYGKGTKQLEVDAAKTVGTIRSLLGTNRGPISFARPGRTRNESHIKSYKALGIDFIRTHDFYGPTDWHVIFPDWSADPAQAKSYDFASSDARIKAICENGFACFYRLGTSWKGRRTGPINDPPGTIRGPDGRVTHVADRKDFRKWAQICTQTVRHYTQGWNNGFKFPIEYWEIWNEPDLSAQFWTGTPQQYYVMYEEAARAIKALNPKLKVGGPACTGALREAWIEGFIRYCKSKSKNKKVPLDFFSWHSYGGRGEFNPYDHTRTARRIRKALDSNGYTKAENINTEWNAGIKHRLFSNTPAGAAFYASTLACFLDGGLSRAFQYCGDRHPGLGLHDIRTGRPVTAAGAFTAWKRLLQTPRRLSATGSDQRGYNIVAGADPAGRRIRILISDFQSGHNAFTLRITNLPWPADTTFTMTRHLLDAKHPRLTAVETTTAKGRQLTLSQGQKPFTAPGVCLIELDRK